MIVSFLLLILSLYFIQLIRKDVPFETKKEGKEEAMSYKDVLKNKKFIFATASFCLDTIASGSLFVFIPFLLLQRHVSYAFLGVLTSTFFIGNMFGKVFLGRLVDRFGNTKVFILSELSMALFIIILSSATWLPIIIGASIILGIFTKGTIPVLTAMVVESVEHKKGMEKAFGINATFVGAASTIAPFILGLLSDKFGIIMAFNFSAMFALFATIPAVLFSKSK
jgi:MFS family permease